MVIVLLGVCFFLVQNRRWLVGFRLEFQDPDGSFLIGCIITSSGGSSGGHINRHGVGVGVGGIIRREMAGPGGMPKIQGPLMAMSVQHAIDQSTIEIGKTPGQTIEDGLTSLVGTTDEQNEAKIPQTHQGPNLCDKTCKRIICELVFNNKYGTVQYSTVQYIIY
jgi:hypothetical protein